MDLHQPNDAAWQGNLSRLAGGVSQGQHTGEMADDNVAVF